MHTSSFRLLLTRSGPCRIGEVVNFDSDGSTKLLRLFVGLLIALPGLAVQLILQPYARRTDNAVSSIVRLMLVLFFILGIMVKLCDAC